MSIENCGIFQTFDRLLTIEIQTFYEGSLAERGQEFARRWVLVRESFDVAITVRLL
jgi:hypothetical protein